MSLSHLIAYYVILLGCGAGSVVKGHYRLAAVGVVLPFFWILGAVMKATPSSIWAVNFGMPQTSIKDSRPDWTP